MVCHRRAWRLESWRLESRTNTFVLPAYFRMGGPQMAFRRTCVQRSAGRRSLCRWRNALPSQAASRSARADAPLCFRRDHLSSMRDGLLDYLLAAPIRISWARTSPGPLRTWTDQTSVLQSHREQAGPCRTHAWVDNPLVLRLALRRAA